MSINKETGDEILKEYKQLGDGDSAILLWVSLT